MALGDVRRRLPILNEPLVHTRSRRSLPARSGAVPTPSLAVWEFTLACDQACIHCGPRAARARPDELDTEESLALVEQLHAMGVGEISLIGGEAYLRNDFLLIIRRIRELGMVASMATGAYNLSPARIEAMIEAGISTVGVSIDGLESSHDRVRARPQSWKRAFTGLEELVKRGVRVSCNSQINALNLGEHPELLELIAQAGVFSWQLQLTIPHGNACEHPELWLQPYQVLEVFDMLAGLMPRARELGVQIWPGNNLGYFGPHESSLRQPMSARAHYKGCSAGISSIGIESNGVVKGCPTLGGPTNLAGSIREHPLDELWARAPELTYVRRRGTTELWGLCADCYYADICMGGCTATSEPLLGRPGNNPYCHHRALELAARGLRERIEMAREAASHEFAAGAFRLILESSDPSLAGREDPVSVEEPRPSRLERELGNGLPTAKEPHHVPVFQM